MRGFAGDTLLWTTDGVVSAEERSLGRPLAVLRPMGKVEGVHVDSWDTWYSRSIVTIKGASDGKLAVSPGMKVGVRRRDGRIGFVAAVEVQPGDRMPLIVGETMATDVVVAVVSTVGEEVPVYQPKLPRKGTIVAEGYLCRP